MGNTKSISQLYKLKGNYCIHFLKLFVPIHLLFILFHSMQFNSTLFNIPHLCFLLIDYPAMFQRETFVKKNDVIIFFMFDFLVLFFKLFYSNSFQFYFLVNVLKEQNANVVNKKKTQTNFC